MEKKNNFYVISSFFYLVLSIFLTIIFIGVENLNFTNIKWLFSGNDIAGHQTGWHFFKEDSWRFPLGSNPNYGDAIGNSIVYSDSIPLMAFIFKLFNSFMPEKFQYIGFWYLICFFFQGYLSQQLIFKYTKNILFSFLGSFFFIFLPIAIYRMGIHPALFGQWTLILTIYLILNNNENKERLWIFLMLLTSLIHFYFTAINLIVYNFLKLYSLLVEKKINYLKYFQNIFICHIILIIFMYSIGYFEVRVVDTLALGFGEYKLNLLSFFDSTNSINNISWSWLLPDINLSQGEELEGFNYLGLGGLILILILVHSLFKKNLRYKFNHYLNLKILLLLMLIFILSLSNNISMGSWDIIQIPLNKFIYGILSIIRSSGRLFWLAGYFLIFISILILYEKFGKKRSSIVIFIILLIQLLDTSSGIKDYVKLKKFSNYDNFILKDNFWYKDIKNINKIITTKPENYNKNFDNLAYYIIDKNFSKTNIVKTARVDREKAAENRYNLNKRFINKNLEKETIYVVDNLGHLLSLREIYKSEDVGFFYRDNIWTLIKGKKSLMKEEDKKELNDLELPTLSKEKIDISKNSNYLGFGWSHNLNGKGAWSEGKVSNLLFKLNKKRKNIYFEMNIIPFVNKKNKEINIKVYINGKYNNELTFKSNKERNVKFKIKEENIVDNVINVEFKNEDPASPFDLLLSPDSRQLGFLLLNLNFFTKDI